MSRSVPAFVFERIISAEQGMYFVVPEEVPELTGKKGICPGHVQSLRTGKGLFQKSRQKSS
jgi:hypothetical protein